MARRGAGRAEAYTADVAQGASDPQGMSATTASRMVFLGGGLMFVYTALWMQRTQPDENVYVRRIVAIGAFTVALAVFADFIPEVAGPFALMLIVALAARHKGEIGTVLGRAPAGKRARGVAPGTGRPLHESG